MLATLGRLAARHRLPVLAAWAALVLAGGWLGGSAFDRTTPAGDLRPHTESARAQARLDQIDPEGEIVVAVLSGRTYNATSLVDQATEIIHGIRALPGVKEVSDPYTTGSNLVSADSQSSLVVVELDPRLDHDAALSLAHQVSTALHRIDVPQVLVGGPLLAQEEFGEQAISDSATGETIAFAVLIVLLGLLLGGFVAGLLPLAAALATIAATLLGLTGLVSVASVSDYTISVVTLLGLGLAVDFSLLIIWRFREERAASPDDPLPELLARTVATAGRAVLLSGLAIGVALAALFVFADPLLSSMAAGGALVVVVATAAGLTLIPALTATAASRIPPPNTRILTRRTSTRPGLLPRTAAFAQRRPVLTIAAVTAAMLALALPLFQLNLANSDARSLPAGSQARQAHEAAQLTLAAKNPTRVPVVVEAAPTSPAVQSFLVAMRALPGVTDVDVRGGLPADVTVAEVAIPGNEESLAAQHLVSAIRALRPATTVLVGGPAAELLDATADTGTRLPIALAVISLTTLLLLFAFTGSLVVPVKALLMNLLTLLATLGVLVAVFQWGFGAALLGFEPWGALDVTTPLLVFVFVFGLSMDYEAFLLTRIREEWLRQGGRDRPANTAAVLAGISATGPVVTAAALAITVVFAGFALGELTAVKEIGVGMFVAVLLDVTVVRGLLLPAVMTLLGPANWWPHRRST